MDNAAKLVIMATIVDGRILFRAEADDGVIYVMSDRLLADTEASQRQSLVHSASCCQALVVNSDIFCAFMCQG